MTELERVLHEMAAQLGAPSQPFVRLWLDTFPQRAIGMFRTKGENLAHICHALNVAVSQDVLSSAADIYLAYGRRHLSPRDGAIETLSRVKAAGLKTGLISDCSHPLPEMWPDTPLARLIDVPVFSCDVGLRKPDPRIYHLACSRLGIPPKQCVYVGDGGSQELTGASQVGMRAVMLRADDDDGHSVRYDTDLWHGASVRTLTDIIPLVQRPPQRAAAEGTPE
jgi:putative hydrolase of the HAD superfamily